MFIRTCPGGIGEEFISFAADDGHIEILRLQISCNFFMRSGFVVLSANINDGTR